MENPSSHDLSFEVFDDSSNDPCSSPGAYLPHSTPIKNSRVSTPSEITLGSEPEIEAFDVDTSSGEFYSQLLVLDSRFIAKKVSKRNNVVLFPVCEVSNCDSHSSIEVFDQSSELQGKLRSIIVAF